MRHRTLYLGLAAFAAAVSTAIPAYAQDASADDAAGGAIAIAMMCCYGVIGLLALAVFVLWIWMVIDCFQRQEYEFPNSTGNSKTTWLVILLVSLLFSVNGIAAIVYYFMVYKKRKRGTGAAASNVPPAPPGPPMAPHPSHASASCRP
jgi:uncharacterized BrkB/YihY/UPF0761 family membrane protein